MKILVLNAGSSSLKYQLINTDGYEVIARGHCECVGTDRSFHSFRYPGHGKIHEDVFLRSHWVAAHHVLSTLVDPRIGAVRYLSCIDAVGHRIVQGADLFDHSVLIDDKILCEIESLSSLAPLHNPAHVECIRAARDMMPDIPHVAVFDTAFHSTMPPEAYMYALPYEYYDKYKVRKYGFHGTSHRYVCRHLAKMLGRPLDELNIISCHLGSGGSVTCVRQGKVIDTSMGFTPLDGIMMGTRCGSIDPAVIPYIMEKEHLSTEEVNYMLNKGAGFKGFTGVSGDLRHILEDAEAGNARAKLAIDMYVHSVRKYIGAYYAELSHIDGLIFTAGIGENSAYIRELICKDLDHLGISLDPEKNYENAEGEREITGENARVRSFVIPTDEEVMIAHDTKKLVLELNKDSGLSL